MADASSLLTYLAALKPRNEVNEDRIECFKRQSGLEKAAIML